MNTYQEQEIKSACLQDALLLLEEAAAYLKRFPIVPSTQHLIKRVEEFLKSPDAKTGHRLSLEKSTETEIRRKVREAGIYSPVTGLPIMGVEVQGDHVRLKLLHHAAWRSAVSHLKRGIDLTLVCRS